MSKKLKPNRLKEASKEIEALKISKGEKDKIDLSVLERNKKFYHVALVRRVNNPAKKEYENSFVVQIYNKRAYDKLKTKIKSMPIDKMIVLHDPTLEKDDEIITTLSSHEQSKIASKIEKELTEKFEKEKAEAIKKAKEEALAEKNGEEKGGFDVESATLPQLNKFASDKEIDLQGKTSKEDVKAIVLDFLSKDK